MKGKKGTCYKPSVLIVCAGWISNEVCEMALTELITLTPYSFIINHSSLVLFSSLTWKADHRAQLCL